MVKLVINLSNRWLYTFIAIGILAVIGVSVYAVDTSKAWHPADQIDFTTGSIPVSAVDFSGGISGDLKVDGAIIAPEGTLRDDGGGWIRTYGNTGWYSQTHGGGWYMVDETWIRSYGNKNIYHNTGILRTDGTLQVGPSGNRFIVNTAGNVGIGMTSPKAKLHVAGDALIGNVGTRSRIYLTATSGTSKGAYLYIITHGTTNANPCSTWGEGGAVVVANVYHSPTFYATLCFKPHQY